MPSLPANKPFRIAQLWRRIWNLFVIFGLALSWIYIYPQHWQVNAAEASQETAWGIPLNLSQTGAASQPRIFATPDGKLQAFWIDRFDGLMTALFNGETWSLPAQSLMLPPENRLGVNPLQINNMPALMLPNANGKLHAFYFGSNNPSNQTTPIFHSQLSLGKISWQYETQVADSAIAFAATSGGDRELKLAYIRTLKNLNNPNVLEVQPGLYFRTTSGYTLSWNFPKLLDTSPYYRVMNADQVEIQLASSGQTMVLVWSEPHLDQLVTSISFDSGKTWSAAQPLNIPGKPAGLTLMTLPDGRILRIWQDSSQPGCIMYQQPLVPAEGTDSQTPGSWGDVKQILDQIAGCPENNQFLTLGETIYWIWGEGTNQLHLSAWDQDKETWSLPQDFFFNFQDPETLRLVDLDDLHTTLAGDRLAVIGLDRASGDVWAVTTQSSALELVFAPPSPWSYPVQASDSGQQTSHPAITIDQQGKTHLVWNQGASLPGTSLYYAHFDEQSLSKPIEIVRASAGEVVDQPVLLADSQEFLHLVWISGTTDQVSYSRARTLDATRSSGWLPTQIIAETLNASWPQIAVDSTGRLVVVYTSQINETRGVYLVTSKDHGDTWSQPILIFDAVASNWETVDHPSIVITPDGNLHIAFVRSNLLGASVNEVHYLRSLDPLTDDIVNTRWTEPVALASQGADWPRLVFLADQLHLLYLDPQGLEHRWLRYSNQASDGLGWEPARSVPDWQEIGIEVFSENIATASSLQQLPYALVNDSQTLHLIAPVPGKQSLLYSTWAVSSNAPSSRNWQTKEMYSPSGNWENQVGVAAAVPGTGGKLAIAWLAKPDNSKKDLSALSLPAIFVNRRVIGEAAPAVPPILLPTVTPILAGENLHTATPQSTPTLAPDLPPSPTNSTISPFILGGGLAAFIVVLIFTSIMLRGRRR